MPPEETYVEPEALREFARRSVDRSDRFDTLGQRLESGRVARMSFGVMPASFSLFDAYTEQIDACVEGLRDGMGLMDDIASGLRDLEASYTGTDVANKHLFTTED